MARKPRRRRPAGIPRTAVLDERGESWLVRRIGADGERIETRYFVGPPPRGSTELRSSADGRERVLAVFDRAGALLGVVREERAGPIRRRYVDEVLVYDGDDDAERHDYFMYGRPFLRFDADARAWVTRTTRWELTGTLADGAAFLAPLETIRSSERGLADEHVPRFNAARVEAMTIDRIDPAIWPSALVRRIVENDLRPLSTRTVRRIPNARHELDDLGRRVLDALGHIVVTLPSDSVRPVLSSLRRILGSTRAPIVPRTAALRAAIPTLEVLAATELAAIDVLCALGRDAIAEARLADPDRARRVAVLPSIGSSLRSARRATEILRAAFARERDPEVRAMLAVWLGRRGAPLDDEHRAAMAPYPMVGSFADGIDGLHLNPATTLDQAITSRVRYDARGRGVGR